MNENFSLNNMGNDDSTIDTKENDYENLITRLKEISSTIALLEKQNKNKL